MNFCMKIFGCHLLYVLKTHAIENIEIVMIIATINGLFQINFMLQQRRPKISESLNVSVEFRLCTGEGLGADIMEFWGERVEECARPYY